MEGSVNPETIIYLLKNQLVEAAICNHNLKRVISLLIWKLNVERANVSIRSEMGTALQKTVDSFERLMAQSSEKRHAWKQQLEKLDYDISCLRQQLESWRASGGELLCPSAKPRLRKPINKRVFNHQSTWMIPDSAGRCASRLFSPPQRRMSGMGFGRDQSPRMRPVSSFKDRLQPPAAAGTPIGDCVATEVKAFPTPNTGGAIKPEMTEMGAGREEADKLERNLQEARSELAWHKALSDLLMEELTKTRQKADVLREQVADIKDSAEQTIKDESSNWQMTTEKLKVRLG